MKPANAADDVRLGLFLGSYHPLDRAGFTDNNNIQHDWHENNLGGYVIANGWMLGRYENSYSTEDRTRLSTVIAYEIPQGSWHGLDISVTAGLANGYPDWSEDEWDNYRGWVSLTLKLGPVKTWYAYKVAAFGLETPNLGSGR